MKIVERNKQGDYVAVYNRLRSSANSKNDIRISALIPYRVLISTPQQIKTSDLTDVRFLQRNKYSCSK